MTTSIPLHTILNYITMDKDVRQLFLLQSTGFRQEINYEFM